MNNTAGRHLTTAERLLLEALAPGHSELNEDRELLVEDLKDGGMGSVRFISPSRVLSRGTREVANAEYVDDDNVLVSIALTEDADGRLFELDFWKTDFSPLRRYPNPNDLRIIGNPGRRRPRRG